MFINRTSFIPREQEGQALFSSNTKSLRTEYLVEARYYAFFENLMIQIFLAQVRFRDKTLLFRQAVSYILNYSSLCGFRCNHHILLWIEKVDIAALLAQVLVFIYQNSVHIENDIPRP